MTNYGIPQMTDGELFKLAKNLVNQEDQSCASFVKRPDVILYLKEIKVRVAQSPEFKKSCQNFISNF